MTLSLQYVFATRKAWSWASLEVIAQTFVYARWSGSLETFRIGQIRSEFKKRLRNHELVLHFRVQCKFDAA